MGGVRVPLFAFIVYVIIYPDVSSHGTNVCFSLSLESSWASLQVFYKHSFICTSFFLFAIENISEITEFNFDQLTSQLPRKTFRFFLRYISKPSLWIKLQNYSWIFFWKYYEALFNTTYLIMVLFFQTFSSKDFIFFRSVISSLLISDVDLLVVSGNYFTW